ncbi:MAG: porin PorA family protein, partial [Gordonia amarae]
HSSESEQKAQDMRTRRWPIAAATVGVLLIVAAFIVSFVVTPVIDKLPSDTDRTAVLAGTMQVPNPADPTKMVSRPVEIERKIKVEKVDGDDALVSVSTSAFGVPRGADEKPLSETRLNFGVDRNKYGQAPAPDGTEVADQQGASLFAFPHNPSKDGQTFYDTNLAKAVPLTYEGSKDISGRETLTFKASNTGPVGDQALAGRLYAALGKRFGSDGKSIPSAFLAKMGVPAAVLKAFGPSLPVSLVVTSDVTIHADKKLGLFTALEQGVQVSAVIGDSSRPLTKMPVQILKVAATDATVADTIDTLKDAESKLAMLRLWIPLVLGVLGLILVAAAVVLWRRAGSATTGTAGPTATDSPVGAEAKSEEKPVSAAVD